MFDPGPDFDNISSPVFDRSRVLALHSGSEDLLARICYTKVIDSIPGQGKLQD